MTEEKQQVIENIYQKVVHWKSSFFIITRNKTGYKFVDTLNCILSSTIDHNEKNKTAIYAAMVMPHLILARTKSSNDGSINKTVSRRLDQWIKGEYEEL